ncbi:DUF4166 domain-containing protein [Radiobacillus kanasensis]|uniref:DUF4166 domain-containing protein n=1 Tax=Radiobacillus kanasensis TaxID=2844358 RepID=UPI001E57E7F5|nr:DUF4166 domain-containing protein [Radiobacillus kanasensis]UFT99982.1 DUF4166 domain-containing protein [Radiobacillus kanasensis]
MSIYRDVMGEAFHRLHPMLQKRYCFTTDSTFVAKGTMHVITGGPRWLAPLFWLAAKRKLLFPERGCNVPFIITNRTNEKQVHWERAFYFPGRTRYFNAVMRLDSERCVIEDYLGESAVVYSDLVFVVSDRGSITISSQNQRLLIGKKEIPLPKMFQGIATVKEGYDDEKGVYTINVSVRNPIIGRVFAYEGEFVQHENKNSRNL